VRAGIAIWFAGVTGFLFATGAVVPEALLAITAVVNTHYFSQVGEERRTALAYGEPAAPYVEEPKP
jgi:hypothetical protein